MKSLHKLEIFGLSDTFRDKSIHIFKKPTGQPIQLLLKTFRVLIHQNDGKLRWKITK